MKRHFASIAALALLVAWGLLGCAPSTAGTPTSTGTTTSGTATPAPSIAQVGGLRVTLQVTCPSGVSSCAFSSVFAQTMSALEQRARAGLGSPDASVKRLDGTRVEVDVPGYTNEAVGVRALTTQGLAQFIDTDGTPLPVGATVSAGQYPVLFTGSQLDPNSIQATLDQNNAPIVTFEFQGSARSAFATYTRDNVGSYLTITLDGKVIESATIQSEIDGQGQIMGIGSVTDAQALAACLKSTPLPAPVTLVSASVISAGGA